VWARGRRRSECGARAAGGAVGRLPDVRGGSVTGRREVRVDPAEPRADRLVTLLDEVIYLMDVTGRAPVGAELTRDRAGPLARLDMADLAELPQIGAVPKAVSLHGLRVEERPDGWLCEVTLDV